MSTTASLPESIEGAGGCASKRNDSPLVNIEGVLATLDWVPSRYNARSYSEDGTLLLYNSYSGAFSGFPSKVREQVEGLLHKKGAKARAEGLVKYMVDRGFIVPRGTNELQRVRMLYGVQQHRNDRLELILLASEECNFRCVYCYENFARDTMEKWVREAILQLVERRVPYLNSMQLAWFGGEPLLGLEAMREIAPACVELTEKHGVAYSSNITTNAYLMTPDVFADLLRWKISSYQITIDGTAEAHDKKRVLKGGGPSFAVIYENLKAMRAFQDKFSVHVRINFDRENLPCLDEFMDMLKRDFAGDQRFQLRFYPVGQWGGPNDDKLAVCGTGGTDSRNWLELKAIEKGLYPESKLPYMTPHSGASVCYAARPYNLLIGADGKIMKCTIALDTKDYNIVGKMTPDGRAEIDVDKFARWVSPDFEDDPGCKKCFYLPVCQGCSCPLVRIEENKRPCPDEKLHISSTLKSQWVLKQQSANRFDLNKNQILPR
jgi:uncharacterized protein